MARSGITSPARGPGPRVTVVLNVVLAAAAAVAVAALVLEYGGFRIEKWHRTVLHVVQTVVVAVFVLDRLARMLLARRRGRYVRENWVDFAVMGTALAAVLIGVQFREHIASAGALYVIITQAYILVSLVVRAVNVNLSFAESGIRPPLLLIGSFAFLCLAGSGLLMLPAAVHEEYHTSWYYPEALFTAVSATCVTGLIVVDTGAVFTPFGQAVILTLIQLGGLGIMLFGTVFAILVGRGLSVRGSTAMGEILATEKVGQLRRVAVFVVLATLAFEAVGALVLYPMFSAPQGADGAAPAAAKAVWDSVFHSISSFCNAGFCLYTDNMMQGVRDGWSQPLRDHWQVYGVIAPLIVLGGLGFPVLQDCGAFLKNALVRLRHRLRGTVEEGMHNAPRLSLSLHTKIVLTTTVVLLAGGAILLLLAEPQAAEPGKRIGRHEIVNEASPDRNDWRTMDGAGRLRGAIFQSVTARTAGFNTIDMSELSNAGKLLTCGLMVAGGSPASTAGGMKTATLAVLALAVWSVLMRRPETEAFRRTLSMQIVRKALALAALYLLLVFVVTLLLSMAMRSESFLDVLFESCSACGTVGLSTGITTRLGLMGKFVVTAAMFVGRLGPLTMLMALIGGLRLAKYTYPNEQVIIG